MKRRANRTGSVVKLSGNCSRPYMVRSAVTNYDERGNPIFTIIGYTATRDEGLQMLIDYNDNPYDPCLKNITLERLFQKWLVMEYPALGKSNQSKLKSAYKWISSLEERTYSKITYYDIQKTIDDCTKSNALKSSIKALWVHLDTFALRLNIITSAQSATVKAPASKESNKKVFTSAEINWLWEHSDRKEVQEILILLYTGYRISELLSLEKSMIDLDEKLIRHRMKTNAGKDRIIPIHPRIFPFIDEMYHNTDCYIVHQCDVQYGYNMYQKKRFRPIMREMGSKHTPHECRHTFRSLLDSAGANEKCMDLLMGHSSGGTGRRIYTHKTLEELRQTMLLIK